MPAKEVGVGAKGAEGWNSYRLMNDINLYYAVPSAATSDTSQHPGALLYWWTSIKYPLAAKPGGSYSP